MMDLAVDITSGVSEVIRKKPGIGAWEAVGSGMRIGQAAMGTMTTTLLLAYSGGCMAQLMVFMAQGTPHPEYSELQICSQRDFADVGGQLWSGNGGALYRCGGRAFADPRPAEGNISCRTCGVTVVCFSFAENGRSRNGDRLLFCTGWLQHRKK